MSDGVSAPQPARDVFQLVGTDPLGRSFWFELEETLECRSRSVCVSDWL